MNATAEKSGGTARSAHPEYFSSRLGVLLAAIGMAVGTGNIWRFPKVAAANGGGVFILLWLAFLFLWSIPLMAAESSIGRTTRLGTLGSFNAILGRRGAWMGGFVALAAAGIMCYYSVITGWCLKYFISTVLCTVNSSTGPEYWHSFAGSWEAVGFHLAAAVFVGAIVLIGVRSGIERSALILIPALAVILTYSAIRALLLPGAFSGVKYLFHFNLADFAEPRIYLEALTQSAWSTGGGWGLLLTYSVYSRPREHVVENSAVIGISDSAASILAALAIIPTVFALLPEAEALQLVGTTGETNTGLTFIWMPRLLGSGGGGQLMLVLFFLALLIAALTSLISLVELAVRNLIDTGLRRKTATLLVIAFVAAAGTPSALWSNIFDNQDWVWSLGLLVCGFFFCIAVRSYGAPRFRKDMVNLEDNRDIRLGKGFDLFILKLIPLQFVVLLSWWFYRSVNWDPVNWWNPLSTFSIGSSLLQWALAIALMLWLGPRLARRLKQK